MTSSSRFAGRVVLVTGGAGSFGRAIAERFSDEGAHVLVADLDLEGATAVASALPVEAAPVQLDVTRAESVAAAMALAEERFAGLDVVVNNAGLTHRITPLEEFSDESFASAYDLVFDVNVKGTFLCSRHAIAHLRRRRGATIVNTSSVAAMAHRPGNTIYSAAKAAVVALTRSLAVELAPDIRVNAVLPVAANTPFMVPAFGGPLPAEAAEAMRAGLPMGRLCEPTDVAAAVAYLASDEASFLTGVALPVDGGRSLG